MALDVTEYDDRTQLSTALAVPARHSVAIQTHGSQRRATLAPPPPRLHVWSAELPDNQFIVDAAECHRRRVGGIVQRVRSLDGFVELLAGYPTPLLRLSVFAHGDPGLIRFEDGSELCLSNVRQRLANLDARFRRDARIDLFNCRVAHGFLGKTFLYEVCEILLRKGGQAMRNKEDLARTLSGRAAEWITGDDSAYGYGCFMQEGGEASNAYGWVQWIALPEPNRIRMNGRNLDERLETVRERSNRRDASRYELATDLEVIDAEMERYYAHEQFRSGY